MGQQINKLLAKPKKPPKPIRPPFGKDMASAKGGIWNTARGRSMDQLVERLNNRPWVGGGT